MIIPVRCVTCGKVIAGKWEAYEHAVQVDGGTRIVSAHDVAERSAVGKILDKLGITKLCCRRHFLSNVDLMDNL